MSKILVTGGAGFIGTNLCNRLLGMGHSVICLDNLSSGKRENIEPLLKNPQFEFVLHDVITPYDYEVDQIYNLACPASPKYYQKDPIHTLKTNVLGAMNALNLAKKVNARVFQTSTSEIYGDALVHPQTESYWGNVNPIGPRACYDEGKRLAETLFFEYNKLYGVDIRVIRIFNTYGPYMRPDDGRVISNFINQAIENRDITIYGTGNQTRSFCYIDDLIDAMIKFMNNDSACTGPMNVGNPEEYTIAELAQKVIALLDSKSQIVYHELPIDDPRLRRPDISLAKTCINWQPTVAIDEGLNKTLQYFRDIRIDGN